jgi:hypothetical protein
MSENSEDKNDDFYLMDPCSICLNMVHKQEMKILDCGHYFHSDCVDEWINIKLGNYPCPMCMRIYDTGEIVTIQPMIEESIIRAQATSSLIQEYCSICTIFAFLLTLIGFVVYLVVITTPR